MSEISGGAMMDNGYVPTMTVDRVVTVSTIWAGVMGFVANVAIGAPAGSPVTFSATEFEKPLVAVRDVV
jgi:hypothetical protein